MIKYKKYLNSIFFLYLLWMSFLIINLVWSIFTSDYKEKIGEESFDRFIVLTLGFSLVIITFGALLAWLAQKGKLWASWLFVIFCSWQAFDAIRSNIWLNEISTGLPNSSDWIWSLSVALIWIYFVGLTWRLRSQKKSNLD